MLKTGSATYSVKSMDNVEVKEEKEEMNIYQETYETVKAAREKWYEVEINPWKHHPDDQLIMTNEAREKQWLFIAKYLQEHASEEVITTAKEKYPILQQLIQNNESEVRS